jgi:hypothetical protein
MENRMIETHTYRSSKLCSHFHQLPKTFPGWRIGWYLDQGLIVTKALLVVQEREGSEEMSEVQLQHKRPKQG